MNTAFKLGLSLLMAGSTCATLSAATVYFSDDFDSGLGQWYPGTAITVPASGHGQVMTFTGLGSGGDAHTLNPVVPALSGLYLSFDYKGGGGYIGLVPGSNYWIAGEAGYGSSISFTALNYDGFWHHYDLPIQGGVSGQIITEDFVAASAHGAFFDNIMVTDYAGASISTPDASSTALLASLSLAGLVGLRRKLS